MPEIAGGIQGLDTPKSDVTGLVRPSWAHSPISRSSSVCTQSQLNESVFEVISLLQALLIYFSYEARARFAVFLFVVFFMFASGGPFRCCCFHKSLEKARFFN